MSPAVPWEGDVDARVVVAEAGQKGRHRVYRARRQQRPDRYPSLDEALQIVDLLPHTVHLGEHAARAFRDRLARLRGHDGPARPREELGAELRLEPADLVRERRLGDVQLLRGAGDVPVPGHRFRVSQLPDLHVIDRKSRSIQ